MGKRAELSCLSSEESQVHPHRVPIDSFGFYSFQSHSQPAVCHPPVDLDGQRGDGPERIKRLQRRRTKHGLSLGIKEKETHILTI